MQPPAAAPRRILVVAIQRLGDVLLATPLIRSLRRAWPQAQLCALVFEDTRDVLAANPDLDAVITVQRRPSFAEHVRLLRALWRRYDLALSIDARDRPTLYACIAGKRRLGMVSTGPKHAWKRRLLHAWVPFDDHATHTVVMNLRLADLAGATREHSVTLAWTEADANHVNALLGAATAPFAVLHSSAKFVYKAWHDDGWDALGRWLAARGMRIVLTGSNEPEELAAVATLRARMPEGTTSMAGALSLPQVAYLLSRAALVIGPDTVVTHTAAAVGAPTIALFGPSNPVKWGPWPFGCRDDPSPYTLKGSQRVGNVYLVQGTGACVPCLQEGCERHIRSRSACLDQLPAAKVIAAAQALLDPPGGVS